MFKRKNVTSRSEDTQPIDYKRLAKEVAKEQKRKKANEQARGCLILVVILVVVLLAFESDDLLSSMSERPLATTRETALPAQPTLARQTGLQVAINFPLLDQVVSGSVDIVGTVNSPDLGSYYVEFRPLSNTNKDLRFPATLPRIEQKIDEVLDTWITNTLRDGMYELRLNVNAGSGPTQRFHFGPVEVRNSAESEATVATPTLADAVPNAGRNIPEYVCTDRQVNLRTGAGYSAFEIDGRSQPGQSFKVVDEVEGESVQGNTKWILVENGRRQSYVTALYTYPCSPRNVPDVPTAVPAEQATRTYITTCNDRNLLLEAESTGNAKVRRAEAMCISKQIIVEFKISENLFAGPLSVAQHRMYELLCALRITGYGMTFDIVDDFVDKFGNVFESRAILARFEPDTVQYINCDSYASLIKWEIVAESWWLHRALSD